MKCRKNVKNLMPYEKSAFVQAIIDLKKPGKRPSIIPAAQDDGATSRYDDYVWIHRAHCGAAFLPWHREFLKQFELDLQDVSTNPRITLPYWDWTLHRSPGDPGWPFTIDLMGGLGTGSDNRVETGRFAEVGGEWLLNIHFDTDNTTYLRRRSDTSLISLTLLPDSNDADDCLGITVYDAFPWNNVCSPTSAQLQASFRKFLESVLHNIVHPIVGDLDFSSDPPDPIGSMSTMTSPNDPTFWLHHSNIDRLWAIWQQKYTSPITDYLPPTGTTSFHDINDNMSLLTASNFTWPVASRPIDVLDHRALGYWYDTDLPIVSFLSPSVNFGNIPVNSNTSKPVQFAIRTCQSVGFRITSISGTNFSEPPSQGTVIVNHSDTIDPVTGNIYIQFHSVGPEFVLQSGSATVEAFINDADGYFASNVNDVYIVGSWNVNLMATPVPEKIMLKVEMAEPHEHMKLFPVFIKEGENILKIDPSKLKGYKKGTLPRN